MTREEAIEILERLIPIPQRADGHSTTHLLIKIALNKAIEALKQEPCGDDISRHDVECIVEELENICHNAPQEVLELLAKLKNVPFVTPKPKTGHWIGTGDDLYDVYSCSECGSKIVSYNICECKFCPNCGADMREGDA